MEKPSRGYVLVEVILSSVLFLFLVVALGGALIYGQEATVLAGHRSQAIFLAEEALEAARNIRDEDYDGLVNGTYGLVNTDGVWALSGLSDINGLFVRLITISDGGSNSKQVNVVVGWPRDSQRTVEVTLETRLSGWQVPVPPPEPPPSP